MKSEIEITEIVKRHGGRHLQFGNVPSWVNKAQLEGVELRAEKIRPFWIQDGSRVYDEAPSQPWQVAIDEIEAKEPEKKSDVQKYNEQTGQNLKTEQVPVDAAPGVIVGIVPDTLTKALLEKWAKMPAFERMLMFQNTPEDMIETRPGPGGKQLKYVKGNKILQELNIAFLFNWSSTIEEVKETETGYWVRGYITVEADNVSITRAAIGTADKHKGVNSEDVAKAAATDMIKKAASSLGFNGDVYRGEV